jgi:hypothetical protein
VEIQPLRFGEVCVNDRLGNVWGRHQLGNLGFVERIINEVFIKLD